MPAETAPSAVYSDGLIKSPSERWLGPFDAMCRFGVALPIDIAEVDALYSDEEINARWWQLVDSRIKAGGTVDAYDTFGFAMEHFVFPDRVARIHEYIPGETIVNHSIRNIQASFRLAQADTTSQIGSDFACFESGGRFSDKRRNRARFYGWDQLPVCKAVLRTMSRWGLMSVASTLANRKQIARKNQGRIGNANTPWGATRNQGLVELRMWFDYIEHLHALPDNFAMLSPTDQQAAEKAVERARAEALIADVDFYEAYFMSWREGADDPNKLGLAPGSVYKNVFRLPNGGFGYRDHDAARGPRDEMRETDLDLLREWATIRSGKAATEWATARSGQAPSEEEAMLLFDSLRVSAATGEDFREVDQVQAGSDKFYTLRTAHLASIRLNALQYENACKLAYIYRQKAAIALETAGDDLTEVLAATDKAIFFETEAANLQQNIQRYFKTKHGYCADYNFVTQKTQPGDALAGVFALGAGVFSQETGSAMLDEVEKRFGRPGGLVNTLAKNSKQQWDNNAWAIMQMEAVDAAVRYQRYDLALLWTKRWLASNDLMFEKYHVLYEKSNPDLPGEPGGAGEYDCVENLLMSLAVDLYLRDKLGRLETMAASRPAVKHGTSKIEPVVPAVAHMAMAKGSLVLAA